MKSLLEEKMKALVEKKRKAGQESGTQLKERAGEALAMLSMGSQCNSEAIRSFTECGDVVHCLTEMLDSKIKTIKCRISAAVILKHLCTHCTLHLDQSYVSETTLKKVLQGLLHMNVATQTNSRSTYPAERNDIENQPLKSSGRQEASARPSQKQQAEMRRLQAALLSLCTAIRANINVDLASVVVPLKEKFLWNLKEIVEENSYATPACLTILKLTCDMVKAFIHDDQTVEEIENKKEIVNTLSQASEAMAGLESCMLFSSTESDCHGVPVKPLSSVLVKQLREVLRQKEQELGIASNTTA